MIDMLVIWSLIYFPLPQELFWVVNHLPLTLLSNDDPLLTVDLVFDISCMIDSIIRAMLEGEGGTSRWSRRHVPLFIKCLLAYYLTFNVWLWQHNRTMLEGKVELPVDHGDMYLCSSNVAETTGLFNYLTVFYQYLSKRYN